MRRQFYKYGYPLSLIIFGAFIHKLATAFRGAADRREKKWCQGVIYLPRMMNWDVPRLGNKMFMFAAAYGISKQLKMGLVAHSSTDISMLTSTFQQFEVPRSYQPLPSLSWFQNRYSDKWKVLNCDQSVNIDGFLQSWRYFHDYREELKQEIFVFKEETRIGGRQKLESIKKDWMKRNKTGSPELIEVIGIHVRRGDFIASQPLGFVPSNVGFIKTAIDLVISNLSRPPIIVVVSDDADWCYRELGHIHPNIYVLKTSRDPAIDLYLLSLCDQIILSAAFSTFGWWGAYLSDAEKIYFNREVVKKDSYYGKEVRTEDHCPPEWIPI